MDKSLLNILVCPICKSHLSYNKAQQELVCMIDKLAFSIKDGIPNMLTQQARIIPLQEISTYQ